MANVFQSLKPKASLSRNGFDLSQRHLFSTKAGMITPVACVDCIPNDYHEISLTSLVRTLPLATDAFARMRVRFCFGFVPYWQNWHPWNEFITQTIENQSVTENSSTLPAHVPQFALGDILETICDGFYALGDQGDKYDEFNQLEEANALRMLDMLGYGSYYDIGEQAYHFGTIGDANSLDALKGWINDEYGQYYLNAFRVAAYQKFYSDYFRNPIYENADASLFNFDLYGYPAAQNIPRALAYRMFANLQYSLYAKDMFTGLYPQPQFGAVSSIDIVEKKIINGSPVAGSSASNAKVTGTQSATPGLLRSENSTGKYDKWSIAAAFDVYDLKRAEALQAWKETKLRAGSKVKDQSNAFWGQPFRYSMDNYCEFIDEIDLNLNIDEVLSTAATSDASLGQIGGKSIGVSNGKIKFSTKDFGTLICVAIVEPVGEYNALMVDKNVTLAEPFDFATPQFDNLGFESVHQYQLSLYNEPTGIAADGGTVLGYAPRYLNYKTAIDKCHGEFMRTGHYAYSDPVNGSEVSGSLSHWCVPRTEMQLASIETGEGVSLNDFKINPKIVDNIFYVASDYKQDTDQFIFNCNFDIKSVRSLSVLGLPRW